MSCQVKCIANINEVVAVRKHLFPFDENRGSDNWLQKCLLSLSPIGDLLLLAHEKRLVCLNSRWDQQEARNAFQATSDSNYCDFQENVTAVLCLPIVVQSQSSNVGPDWSCIVLGFDTGYVRFYTEHCTLLYEEQFHNEAVQSIKCQSQHHPRPDICSDLKPEELYISYLSNICVLNGATFFNSLRSCRSQLAKDQASGQTHEPISISINPKKWGFVDQAQMNDASVVGLDLSNTFDHLLTASTCGGFDSKYRAMPPHNTLVLCAGSKPFLGFHYALEGGAQPVLSDVAKAVASKLKSALPGWLVGNKTQSEKPATASLQPAEAMACRFGLCDARRIATHIILSYDKKFALVSDALGRVLLVDTHRGIVVRIFKGYRDSQCAFIQVPDERKTRRSHKYAIALFFVVYSPRKATLEVFCTQMGSKIATFSASKYSTLLYINYGLMGFQSTSKSRFICQYSCVLVDPDGLMKEIIIPFHYALNESNSKRVRDLHLFKRLKQFIRSCDKEDETRLLTETLGTCKELTTYSVKLLCLELLAASREIDVNVLKKCSELFRQTPSSNENNDNNDVEAKQLRIVARNLSALCDFYRCIDHQDDEETEDDQNGNSLTGSESKLVLGEKEMSNLQRLLDLMTLNKKNQNVRVKFSNENEFLLSDFLQIFDYTIPNGKIQIKNDVSDAKLYATAEKLFKTYIAHGCRIELKENILQSRIDVNDLFSLLLLYWVERPIESYVNLENDMTHFVRVLFEFTRTVDMNEIYVDYNEISVFWENVRDVLANSARPFPALMAAILCKHVAQKLEAEKDLEEWEKLSQENCRWQLLIGKLEDVSLLNIIIANRPICSEALPKLRAEHSDVSLKYILEKGRGAVSEIVAQWLTSGGFNPEQLISDLDEENQEEDKEDEAIVYHIDLIRRQFPYSLETSTLLANMCWEYALHWQKNIQDFSLLTAAVKCMQYIPNIHIKLGIYHLVWNTHLKVIFESAAKLVNKVGKLPKERLCRQDTDLSDYQVTLFVEQLVDFFDCFMECLMDSYNSKKPVLQCETIWENGSKPLVELALSQCDLNYDLLHLHYQLSLVLHVMCVFSIKHIKFQTNLFDSQAQQLFFIDFQSQVPFHQAQTFESKLNASRLQFLIKVITATMETITLQENQEIYSLDHVQWMSKCLALARYWNLDVDLLKRYQVAQCYACGYDSLGEELVAAVSEREKLGPDLLAIAGKRLKRFLQTSNDLSGKFSALATHLTQYLEALNGDWCAPSNLELIINLVTHATRCLKEEQPEFKVCAMMMEACLTLKDL